MKRKGKLASVLNRSTVATLLAGMVVVSSFSAIAVSADLFASGGKKQIVASSGEDSVVSYESGKVYFLNTPNWSTPYCYAWNSSNTSEKNDKWPGVKMTDTGKTYSGCKIYECSVGDAYDKVIFNIGSDKAQTKNLDKTSNAVYVYSDGKWKDLQKSSGGSSVELGDFDYFAENGFTQSNIFAVNASYFDYLSDKERSDGWLKPIQAGTGFEGSQNNWYPFWNFNDDIKNLASSTPSWEFPLYFGNFCNTGRAYMGKNNDHGGYHNGTNDSNYADINNTGYMQAKKNLVRWDYFANNSNALAGYHYAVRDLALDKLVDDNIRVGTNSSNINMPYFDAAWLGTKAKKIKSYFPFRISSTNDVTQYVFSSEQATDNVYFTWKSDGSPDSVKYGAGKSYGIEDGYQYFMGKDRPDYITEDPYGIFPFNNKQEGENRKGNSNLDYGFGIKLDIDFRVPKDGLLVGDTPVTFEYSGDDDLWVYLTDDEGNSKLVLDLGGNHKMTEGKLDFSTMKATSKNTSYLTSDKSNMLFIADNSDMPNCTYRWDAMYMWAWSDSFSGEWFQLAYDENSSTYYACKDQVGSNGHKLSECTRFKLNGERSHSSFYQSDSEYKFSDLSWGKKYTLKRYDNNEGFWFDKSAHSAPSTAKLPYFTAITEDFSFDGAGTTLDPKKTYHMTVFYMERGTLESNFKVAFTMTPVTNEFLMDKTVNADEVNSAIQDEVKSLDDFKFEIKSGSTAETVTQVGKKDYTHTSGLTTTEKQTNEGKLTLKDKESAHFNSQFKSGDYMEVTETSSSNLTYRTTWRLTDEENGNVTNSSGTDSKEASFKYGKSGNFANYSLGFVNTPELGYLEVSKKVNKTGTEELSDEFTVKIEIDLDGDGTKYGYSTYALDCEKNGSVTKLNADGTIALKENEKVVIKNLPDGAMYRVTETKIPSGFTAQSPAGIEAGVTGTISSKAVEKVDIVNKKSEGSATVDVVKKLDYEAYNSADYSSKPLFAFDLTEVNADGTNKIGGASETTKTAVSGKVTFKPFKYTSEGTYYYKITESNISGRDADYKMDQKAVFARVKVTPSASGYDIDTAYSKAAAESRPSALTYGTSTDSKTFSNITLGQLKITKAKKLDGTGNAVSGSELKGATFELTNDSNTDVITLITDDKGVAQFTGLPIKDSDGKFIKYHVKEIKAPAGYLISKDAKANFTFEGAQNASGTYTKGYAFVNLELSQPDSGEVFGNDHLLIGGMFMLFSAMGGLVFLVFSKKRAQAEKFFTKKK